MKYTAEEVRAMASDLRGAPGTSMIGTHISLPTARAVAIYEALCAYAERIKADARPVARSEAAWLERLKDPATVHALMLRGVIAIPSIRSMVDLRGEVPNGEEVQLLRIAELQEQLAAQPAQSVDVAAKDAELASSHAAELRLSIRADLAESRLAAANALLREIGKMADGTLCDEVRDYLQGAGDEA